jgi:hypothetical protein
MWFRETGEGKRMTDEEREKIRQCAKEDFERLMQQAETMTEEEREMLLELEIKWHQQRLDEMLKEKRRRELQEER